MSAVADARTRRLLEAPILPLLLRLAWPNVLIMLAQASTGLIETWWVAKLGTEALAGMALVFPPVLLMTQISAGALGGGISAAVARALGAGRGDEADALVLHAALLNIALGLAVSAVFLAFGPVIYRTMGGSGAALEAALQYSNVFFVGNVLVWLSNGLASTIRGTGNMLYPAMVTLIGIVVLVPLSPLLIFGLGPVPGFGVRGGGLALLVFFGYATVAMAWYTLSGRSPARLRPGPLRGRLFWDIVRVGGLSAVNSLQTNVIVAGATALVAASGGAAALAGYGTGARLEFLLIPLIFGIGAPLVALVGTNVGAGRRERALAIALTGSALAFVVTEAVGLAAAVWPEAWLRLFSDDPAMLAAGRQYLRVVGPAFGGFGVGLALYFASQGAGRLFWPLLGSFLRLLVALGGGFLAGSISGLYGALAAGLLLYGAVVLAAVRAGAWFR